jgi:nucleoside-diphosphate-sugar epimerase
VTIDESASDIEMRVGHRPDMGQLSAMAKVLIAGCGYVGSELARRLEEDGHQVWGLSRNSENLPAGVRPITADLTRLESLGNLPGDLDFVFYTAGAGGGDEVNYRKTYLDGVDRLLNALIDQGEKPKRIFFTSSTAVYDQRRGEEVDEESPTAPSNFRGDIMLCTERLLLAGPFPATIVRLGGIYGPGRDSLLRAIQSGDVEARNGADPHFTNRIHRDDAAGCLRHLMGLDEPLDIYLGVDHAPVDESSLLQWLANRLDVSIPTPGSDESADEGGAKVRRAGSKRCRNDRLLASGYWFEYPTYREGYEMIIRGWIEPN